MLNIDRKKFIILFSVLAIAAVISGFAITGYATDNGEDNSRIPPFFHNRGLGCGRGHGRGGMFGAVEVSEEYEANAITIAESDEDVEALFAEGYAVSRVRPSLRSFIGADGDVTTTATTAIVMLTTEDSTDRAVVWVDLNTDSVTKIVILTRTVIEKDAGSVEVITP